MNAKKLREQRKQRIEARRKKKAAQIRDKRRVSAEGEDGEEMPDWLEEDIEEEDTGEPMMSQDDEGEGEPPADLEEEPEQPADDVEEDAALGAFNYNPVYQKPTKLSNKGGRTGGFHYWGPPPDAGTSYGFYTEGSIGIIAPKAKKIFSPVSGKAMRFAGDLDIDALASVLAVADQMSTIDLGDDSRMTSVSLENAPDPLFDAQTGLQVQMDESTAEEDNDIDEDDDGIPDWEDETPEGGDEAESQDEELPPVEEEAPVEEMESQDEELPMEMEEEGDEEMGDEAESVEYEALQSIEEIDEPVSEADVHMTLFDEGTVEQPGQDPYWNIDIGGVPVARVCLKDQEKAEEIRKVFCSSDYYKGVSGAIAKVGVKPVLKQIKAKLWANEVAKTKLAKDIKAEVSAEAQRRVRATTQNLMKDLLNRIAIVCAGMDKNFYKDVGNPLKEALWGEMHQYGVPNPSPMIEAAFRKGSTKYFQTVISKAVEYLEFEPRALDQIKATIGEMDVMPAGDDNVGDEIPEIEDELGMDSPEDAPTLSDRLAASSVQVAGVSALAGNPLGEHKDSLRSELRLGGTGPRARR